MLLGGKVNIGALVETERNKRLAKLKIVFPAFLIRYICLNKRGGGQNLCYRLFPHGVLRLHQ